MADHVGGEPVALSEIGCMKPLPHNGPQGPNVEIC